MVVYHRPRVLRQCLDSFLRHTPPQVHLAILDNSPGYNIFPQSDRITIYNCGSNLGKGRAFATYYATIMQHNRMDHFLSLDPDLELADGWYQELHRTAQSIKQQQPLGLLAPILWEQPQDRFPYRVCMHRLGPETRVMGPALYNRRTAGCLLYIDRQFYEECGGYGQQRLYGGDDGLLCKHAIRSGCFLGICPTVRVRHLRQDDTPGYIAWKARNVRGPQDNIGHWDTSAQ